MCESLVRANFTNMTDEENLVSQETASWMFYQTVVFTIPSTAVTLFMGLYGDRYGRRIPLLSPLFGQFLGESLLIFFPIFYLAFAVICRVATASITIALLVGCGYYLIMSFYDSLHVKYMLFGAFITGMSGGFACVIMASFR